MINTWIDRLNRAILKIKIMHESNRHNLQLGLVSEGCLPVLLITSLARDCVRTEIRNIENLPSRKRRLFSSTHGYSFLLLLYLHKLQLFLILTYGKWLLLIGIILTTEFIYLIKKLAKLENIALKECLMGSLKTNIIK